jgi:hypothetical protein
VALQGPSGSFVLGFLSMRWSWKAEARFNHMTLNSPNSGLSISSNTKICTTRRMKQRLQGKKKNRKKKRKVFGLRILVGDLFVEVGETPDVRGFSGYVVEGHSFGHRCCHFLLHYLFRCFHRLAVGNGSFFIEALRID